MTAAATPYVGRRSQVGALVLTVVLAAVVIADRSMTHDQTHWLSFGLGIGIGGTTVLAGLLGWERRPASRVGPILVIVGLLYLAYGLLETTWPPIFFLSMLVRATYTSMIAFALVTFPTGRTQNWLERTLVVAVFVFAGLGRTVPAFFNPLQGCAFCPQNLDAFSNSPPTIGLSEMNLFDQTSFLLLVCLAAAFVVYAVRKYRHASPAGKRGLAPVFAVGAIGGTFALLDVPGAYWFPAVAITRAWFWAGALVTILVPLGFLAGLYRTRLARSAVGDLVVELGAGSHPAGAISDALSERLRDPSLEVTFRVSDAYVDESGLPVELPTEDSARAVTIVEAEGEPIAALIHDPVLREEPDLVDSAVAAARLAIVNDRLRAELRAQLEEVRASRQRIVETGDQERRRVERNLHDGAQQRLVGVSLSLTMLRERMAGDSKALEAVDEVTEELKRAVVELRELARGIHPAILTEEGLEAAVSSLAERSPVPILLRGDISGRLPEGVEATAYFVIAEAITNVVKYARASRARVEVRRRPGLLIVEISDDGVGGADPRAGSGLLGLDDRVSAAGGTLRLTSLRGAGTTVIAELPLDE